MKGFNFIKMVQVTEFREKMVKEKYVFAKLYEITEFNN